MSQKSFRRRLYAFVAAVLAATHVSTDLCAVEAQKESEDDPAHANARGSDIYQKICAPCHEGGGRAPQKAVLGYLSPRTIVGALEANGLMQAQGSSLAPSDKEAVAKYLTFGRIASFSEPVPMCSGGRKDWFDFSRKQIAPEWGGDYGNSRYINVRDAGLIAQDIGKLRLKWAIKYPDSATARAQPTIAGGAVYVGSHSGAVYALDEESGCAHWIFNASAEVRTSVIISPWNAGDGKKNPVAFFGDLLGHAYAVDALSGRLIWRKQIDSHPSATLTASPALYEGQVYFPVSSLEELAAANPRYSCCTFRGSLVALDAATGKETWKTYTIVGQPKVVGKSASGINIWAPSGAAVWGTPAIDAKRGLLYVGTGDNYTRPTSATSDAIMAMYLHTGKIAWVKQTNHRDAWNSGCDVAAPQNANCPEKDGPDYDYSAPPLLLTLENGRQILLAAEKSGLVYGLDPNEQGKVLWRTRVGSGGVDGGVNWGIAAMDGHLYVPVTDQHVPDTNPFKPSPGLYSLDAATGKLLWSAPAPKDSCGDDVEHCKHGFTTPPTAIPGVIFQGATDGIFRAYDADTGKLIWDFDTKQEIQAINGRGRGGSMNAAGAAVADGMVFVDSGYTTSTHQPANMLLVFAVKP